jgi:predicted dehydrogenase
MTSTFTRRTFLQTSTTAALASSLASGSPNDTIRLALIGCSGQGVYNLRECLKAPNTKAVAVCDVDQAQLAKAVKRLAEQGQVVDGVKDFRHVLDRKDVDAVIIATPDHWHAIPAVQTMRAGKDLYLEKPIGHTIHEGQVMVKVAQETRRIVSVGLQQRSGTLFLKALEMVQAGQLGKVSLVHCWNAWNDKVKYNAGYRQLKNKPDTPVPDGVDYDFWLGPAPLRPFNQDHYNGTYLYFWDYSGGMTITWGVHLIDSALHVMKATAPSAVSAAGGKFVLNDNRDTPDTTEQTFEFPNFTLTYSCRHANAFPSGSPKTDHGIQFFGTEGTLLVNRSGLQLVSEQKAAEVITLKDGLHDGGGHHQRNFIECLRTRQPPNCDLLTGHRATTACQLANIAYRTGRKIRWDAAREVILGDVEATKLMRKKYRAPWTLS